MISQDTINLCLELLDTVSVPIAAPDGLAKFQRLDAARRELLAALSDTNGVKDKRYASSVG